MKIAVVRTCQGTLMSTCTMRLTDPEAADPRLTGGKGAGLAALAGAGFPVPPGFVITTAAYPDVAADDDPSQPGRPHPPMAVPDQLAAEIVAAYAALGSPPVAVRSSGTAEDLADASFAGQHDTYLNVSTPEALVAAVRDCWASLWTPRAVAYRRQAGYHEAGLALAVVVQTMVDAEWAGVLFTADPVSGRRDRLMVEAVPGLADALASGEQTGQPAVWDKTAGAVVTDDSGLPAGVLAELARLGTQVEDRFGAPQDIEWAYADGHCWLVQARPLTAMPPDPGAGAAATARRRVPANLAMLTEHVPTPPFPIDVSVVLRPAIRAILHTLHRLGLSVPPLDDVLVETGEGVVQVVPSQLHPTVRVVVGVPLAVPKVIRLLRTTPAGWRAATEETVLAPAWQWDREDLARHTDAEISDGVRRLRDALGRLVVPRFGAVPGGMLAGLAARELLRLLVGTDAFRLHGDLMSAVPCVTTASNTAMSRLAERVRSTPELREVYLGGDAEQVIERLRSSAAGRAFLDDVDEYLRHYGCRETAMLGIGAPALRDAPDTVHGLIAGLARHEPSTQRDSQARLNDARRELASLRGLRARLLRPTIVRLLRSARAGTGFREDSHYVFMIVMSVCRRLVLELGRRLVERGVLDCPEDVLYLELGEIQHPDPSLARETVARRRAARSAALPGYTIVPAELLATGDDAGVHGTPASRGTVVGRVRVVRDESDFATLRTGEVLVCPYTNPTWTPLFSLACAVVADTGGPGSHAAIVAREYGIPAVMGTGNGTRLLVTGERVLVDGNLGVVSRLQTGAEQAAPVG